MDTTVLRKLTLKSQMKFGKYYDLTVGQIIDSMGTKGIKYLVWVYYCSSKITFMDEILDELCILPENRIDKPGKVTESDLPLFIQKQKTERINRINSMEEQEKEKYRGIERKLYNERVREDKRHNRI